MSSAVNDNDAITLGHKKQTPSRDKEMLGKEIILVTFNRDDFFFFKHFIITVTEIKYKAQFVEYLYISNLYISSEEARNYTGKTFILTNLSRLE